jgi:hypothetical protein
MLTPLMVLILVEGFIFIFNVLRLPPCAASNLSKGYKGVGWVTCVTQQVHIMKSPTTHQSTISLKCQGVHWHESYTLWKKEKHKLSALERKSESLRRWRFQHNFISLCTQPTRFRFSACAKTRGSMIIAPRGTALPAMGQFNSQKWFCQIQANTN